MKNLKKLCLSLFVCMAALLAAPSLKTMAAQGFLKDVISPVCYRVYNTREDSGIGIPTESTDKCKFTNLTKSTLKFTNSGRDDDMTFSWQDFRPKKKATGKIRIDVTRGNKTYSKTVKIVWFDLPELQEFKVGTKDYKAKVRNNQSYVDVSSYISGKVSMKLPSSSKFVVDPIMQVAYVSNGRVNWKGWYIGRTLPKKCVEVQVSVLAKANTDMSWSYTIHCTKNSIPW